MPRVTALAAGAAAIVAASVVVYRIATKWDALTRVASFERLAWTVGPLVIALVWAVARVVLRRRATTEPRATSALLASMSPQQQYLFWEELLSGGLGILTVAFALTSFEAGFLYLIVFPTVRKSITRTLGKLALPCDPAEATSTAALVRELLTSSDALTPQQRAHAEATLRAARGVLAADAAGSLDAVLADLGGATTAQRDEALAVLDALQRVAALADGEPAARALLAGATLADARRARALELLGAVQATLPSPALETALASQPLAPAQRAEALARLDDAVAATAGFARAAARVRRANETADAHLAAARDLLEGGTGLTAAQRARAEALLRRVEDAYPAQREAVRAFLGDPAGTSAAQREQLLVLLDRYGERRIAEDVYGVLRTIEERERATRTKVNQSTRVVFAILLALLGLAIRQCAHRLDAYGYAVPAPVTSNASNDGGSASLPSGSRPRDPRGAALVGSCVTVVTLVAFQYHFFLVTQKYKYAGTEGDAELLHLALKDDGDGDVGLATADDATAGTGSSA